MSFSLEDILREAKQDPTLQVTPESIAALIEEQDFDQFHYLNGHTLASVQSEVDYTIHRCPVLSEAKKIDLCKRLQGYRVVDDLRDYRPNQQLQFINRNTGKLSGVMIGYDIVFTTNFTNIRCRYVSDRHRIYARSFDRHLVFQKLSFEEYLVLMANGQTDDSSLLMPEPPTATTPMSTTTPIPVEQSTSDLLMDLDMMPELPSL